MDYVKIKNIEDPLFPKMYRLLQTIFPAEEVLEYDLWRAPLLDPIIRMFVAVQDGEVVGATEYRYYADLNIAMTDFTIIGIEGLGIGRFLAKNREKDIIALAAAHGQEVYGMFAEIYNPYRVKDYSFGGIKPMDPFVRREVLSHMGYRRIDFPYVHPSWQNDGEAVSGLDFCFLSYSHQGESLPAALVVNFIKRYYEVLPNKSDAWHDMVTDLEMKTDLQLLEL